MGIREYALICSACKGTGHVVACQSWGAEHAVGFICRALPSNIMFLSLSSGRHAFGTACRKDSRARVVECTVGWRGFERRGRARRAGGRTCNWPRRCQVRRWWRSERACRSQPWQSHQPASSSPASTPPTPVPSLRVRSSQVLHLFLTIIYTKCASAGHL